MKILKKIVSVAWHILKKIIFVIWCIALLLLATGLITPEWRFALTLILIYLICSAFVVIPIKIRKHKKIKTHNNCERLVSGYTNEGASDDSQGIGNAKHDFEDGNSQSASVAYSNEVGRRDEYALVAQTYENENIQYDSMSGEEFEKYVAQILNKMGFCNIRLTKGSGDQGVDILAEKDRIRYAVQCKRYSNPVGNKAVQEIFAGVSFYHCHVGIVATNNYFTKSAKELAYENGVVLWDKDFLDKYAVLIGKPNNNGGESSYEILNVDEKIVAIKNNRAGKVLYQYLLSTSRNAIDVYLKNGDGTQRTEDMIQCVEKPIQLYNTTFDSLLKNICYTFYCNIHQDFKKTSSYMEFAKESEKNHLEYKDDLFGIRVVYSIDNIVLEKGRIRIEYRPEIDMITTTMETLKALADIEEGQSVVYSGNKTYYKGYVTENLFPMKVSNIRTNK